MIQNNVIVPDSTTTQVIDQQKVNEIAATINISESAYAMSYGAKPMNAIAQFSDSLLTKVKAKDAGLVGEQLSGLLMKVREFDPMTAEEKQSSFLSGLPLIGSLFKKAEVARVESKTLTDQVDSIAKHLDQSMVGLLRDVESLEQLYLKNFDFYNEVSLYIEAGKQKLQEVRETELVALQQQAQASGDLMDAQKAKDFMEHINRFERRLHDLELSKAIAIQTAPQIRMIQNNNQTLAEKIQSSILTTLPIWKSQMVLSLSIQAQGKAAQLQKNISDTTNELLRKNAEMLQQNSIATAREVERSVVDIETLREVQNKMVSTIEETMKIASDAKTRRAEVEKELANMEEDLRVRLVNAATQPQQY